MEFPEDFKNKNYEKGSLLIANPVLPDPNFSRTVILLCDHDEQGSFGLVINRSTQLKAPDLFLNINILKSYNEKIYLGGPVSQSMVFFLCRSPSAAGKLDEICSGYSGWSGGQLAEEMEQNSWLVQKANEQFIFLDSESLIWPQAVNSLGEKYQYLTKAPVNPQWN
jgi:putative transcriptional regulator